MHDQDEFDQDDRWVSKTHPLSRDAQTDDPFELMPQVVVGDPDVMLECILQEFIWMGWNERQLLSLFHDPGYPMLCELQAFYGPQEIERRVSELLARSGQLQFTEFVAEPEVEDDDHGPDLLQILPMPERTACH